MAAFLTSSDQVPKVLWTLFCVFFNVIFGSNPEIDLTKEPGHLKPFGTGRPVHLVEEMAGFPDPDTFFTQYYRPQKPVKFKMGADLSPAFRLWTDEYFLKLDIPKASTVHLETVKKENRNQDTLDMNFKKFVKIYMNSSYYMVDSIPPYLSPDVILPCCLQCPDIMHGQLVDNMMWFSSGGTNSVVHTDSVENINCVYRGSKDFIIVDPITYEGKVPLDRPEGSYSSIDVDSMDYTKYPGLAEIEYIKAHLDPGDCLYIPFKWIHQVRSYNSNLAVNIWWNHYDSLKTDVNTCNKVCDKTLSLAGLKTVGFDHLMDSDLTLHDHLLDGIKSAPGRSMHAEDYLGIIFPELPSEEDQILIPEEMGFVNQKRAEFVATVDTNKDGMIIYEELKKLKPYNLAIIRSILKEAEKINKAIDIKFGMEAGEMGEEGEEGEEGYMQQDEDAIDDDVEDLDTIQQVFFGKTMEDEETDDDILMNEDILMAETAEDVVDNDVEDVESEHQHDEL